MFTAEGRRPRWRTKLKLVGEDENHYNLVQCATVLCEWSWTCEWGNLHCCVALVSLRKPWADVLVGNVALYDIILSKQNSEIVHVVSNMDTMSRIILYLYELHI